MYTSTYNIYMYFLKSIRCELIQCIPTKLRNVVSLFIHRQPGSLIGSLITVSISAGAYVRAASDAYTHMYDCILISGCIGLCACECVPQCMQCGCLCVSCLSGGFEWCPLHTQLDLM